MRIWKRSRFSDQFVFNGTLCFGSRNLYPWNLKIEYLYEIFKNNVERIKYCKKIVNYRCLEKIFWIINILLESKIIFWTLNFYLASKAKGRVHYGTAWFSNSANFSLKKPAIIEIFQKFSRWKLKVGFILYVMNKKRKMYLFPKQTKKYIVTYYYFKICIIWQNVAKKCWLSG